MSESPKFVVKLDFESDDKFVFPLATNMVVNFDAEHFYIRFYQTSPPAILNEEPPKMVKAKLVGGAAIPILKMEAVIKALQGNYDRFIEIAQDEISNELDGDMIVGEDAEHEDD